MPDTLPVLLIPGTVAGVSLVLPLAGIRAVFRPLPVRPVPGSPEGVLGLARIRGQETPVLDLERLLGAEASHEATRFVHMGPAEPGVALAVREACRTTRLRLGELKALPALLADAAPALSALVRLDGGLGLVLGDVRLLTEGRRSIAEGQGKGHGPA